MMKDKPFIIIAYTREYTLYRYDCWIHVALDTTKAKAIKQVKEFDNTKGAKYIALSVEEYKRIMAMIDTLQEEKTSLFHIGIAIDALLDVHHNGGIILSRLISLQAWIKDEINKAIYPNSVYIPDIKQTENHSGAHTEF